MYESFFGLDKKPFELTPDCSFLFLNNRYQEILAALVYGVTERRGLIALVGEVGTGKTMMLHAMLERLDPSIKVARIVNPDLTFKQMLFMALCDFEITSPEKDVAKARALKLLNDYALEQSQRGGNVVLVIDEAQNIRDSAMENLRMLSNLESSKQKLIQIVLAGQPELDEKFSKDEWRQLVQRISLKRYSTQLSEQDTYHYINHRLTCAGCTGAEIFAPSALRLIFLYSEGTPRKINILCDNALLIGYGIARPVIDEGILREVASDLTWVLSPDSEQALPPQTPVPAVSDMRVQTKNRNGGGPRSHADPDVRTTETGSRRIRLAFVSGAMLIIGSLIVIWFLAGQTRIAVP